jgi:hypothetical protein
MIKNKIKTLSVLTAGIFTLFIMLGIVSAVGIRWYSESEVMSENSERCVTYGAYNPSTYPIGVKIEVIGDLANVITGAVSEEKIVEAKTPSVKSENVNFCFKIPEVYEEDCLIGNYVCEKTCPNQLKTYRGEVVMTETPIATSGGTGSGVSIAASAPLELTVACTPYPRNWSPVYVVAIVAIVIALAIALFRREKQGKQHKKKRR